MKRLLGEGKVRFVLKDGLNRLKGKVCYAVQFVSDEMSYFQAIFAEPMAIVFGLPGAQSRALGPRILILASIFKIGGLTAFLRGVAQPTRCTKLF